jgi:hypothetical protein
MCRATRPYAGAPLRRGRGVRGGAAPPGPGCTQGVPLPRPGGCTWRRVCREPWHAEARPRARGRWGCVEAGTTNRARHDPAGHGGAAPTPGYVRDGWAGNRDARRNRSRGALLSGAAVDLPSRARRPMNLPRPAAMHRRSRTAGAAGAAARPKKPATSGPSVVRSVSVNNKPRGAVTGTFRVTGGRRGLPWPGACRDIAMTVPQGTSRRSGLE